MKAERPALPLCPAAPPSTVHSLGELRQLQRFMASALYRPLDADYRMQSRWLDGSPMRRVAEKFLRANERLQAEERLEIYNRMYWFRLLDSLHEDFGGLHAYLGERAFWRLAKDFLTRHPPTTPTLRELGRGLPEFIRRGAVANPRRRAAALDIARLEWAEIHAFDAAALPPLSTEDRSPAALARLRVRLQPHLCLLALRHDADAFLRALHASRAEDRGAASNASLEAPERARKTARRRRPRLASGSHFLAVHRSENRVFIKSLHRVEHRLLSLLAGGEVLGEAVARALHRSGIPAAEQAAWVGARFELWGRLGWLCARD